MHVEQRPQLLKSRTLSVPIYRSTGAKKHRTPGTANEMTRGRRPIERSRQSYVPPCQGGIEGGYPECSGCVRLPGLAYGFFEPFGQPLQILAIGVRS